MTNHNIVFSFPHRLDIVRIGCLYRVSDLLKILIEFGIPKKLVRLIKMSLSPLLFNFVLEYDIRKVQVIKEGLKINGTHQVLAYADDVIILG